MRTDLASGEWIEYTPVQDLKGKHKRKLDRVVKPSLPPGAVSEDGTVDLGAVMGGMDVVGLGQRRHDALWAVLIDKWSYGFPVPEIDGDQVLNADSLDEVPLEDYEEIDRVLAPHAAKLSRRPDPKHSTTSASNGSSPARAHGSRTA